MDAKDKQARVPRSRGRSVVVLYNTVRPQSGLGNLTPADYAKLSASDMQRKAALRSIGDFAPLHRESEAGGLCVALVLVDEKSKPDTNFSPKYRPH